MVFLGTTPSTRLYQASRFSQLLTDREILHLGNNNYRFADNTGGVFTLECSDCNELGCLDPRIRKLGERGGAGTGSWDSHFSHFSALEQDHVNGCLCAGGAAGGGNSRRIMRRILESRVYIPANPIDYLGCYRHPAIMEIVMPSQDLTDYGKTLLIDRINTELGESVTQLTEEPLQPDVLWKGIVHNAVIHRINIPLNEDLSYYIVQRNVHDLSHLFWAKNINGVLLPLNIISDGLGASLTITGSGPYYRASTDGRVVAAPLRGGRIQPGNREDLIQWFNDEVEGLGLEPIIKQQDVESTIFHSNQRVRFVYLRNRSSERVRLRLSVQEIGSAQDGEREEMTAAFGGIPSEYVGSQEGEQFRAIEIESQNAKLIRILFTGDVYFKIEHRGQLINSQHIMASVGDASRISLRITNESLSSADFQSLIQEIHPNYTALPVQEGAARLQQKDWIDFDRFMFTESYMSATDGHVAPAGIASRNTRLLNLLTSFATPFIDDEALNTGTTDRFQLMMETSYSGVEMGPVDIEQEERAFVHRLSPTQSGWFGPEDSAYKLLIDHRSWAHLSAECPRLNANDIHFLETGHRLIRNEAVSRYDREELLEIEQLQPTHSLPEDHLFFPFGEGNVAEQQQRYTRLVANLGVDEVREYTYANPFTQQPRFGVFSKDLRAPAGLSSPWEQSEPFVIEREIEGEVQTLSLHRIVLEPQEDIEGVDTRHNLVLILRQEGVKSRAVRVFLTGAFERPPTYLPDEWESLTQKARRMAVYTYMRDTVRAYTSLCMRLGGDDGHTSIERVNEIVSYTVRRFCGSHEQSLINTMREVDSSLALQFQHYLEKKMWLRTINE